MDEYRYGPEGLRYKKVEGTKTTYYLYEGNELLYEEGYEGSTREACRLNVYVGGVNVGRVTKEGSTESVQYFYLDHLGSKRAVTDASGNVQAKIEYSVWGVASVTNYNGYDGRGDISYTGKERDATGLYYFNARYYDPSVGRFITEDPTRNGLNWFVYCNNNPLSLVDPSGLRYTVDAYDPYSEEDVQELQRGTIERMYEAAGNLERRGELEEARYLKAMAGQETATITTSMPILVANGLTYMGLKYGTSFAGKSGGYLIYGVPTSADCSEFIALSSGTGIWRSWEFENNPEFIQVCFPEAGDVKVWIARRDGSYDNHMAIITGDGEQKALLHSDYGHGVRYSSDYLERYYEKNGYIVESIKYFHYIGP